MASPGRALSPLPMMRPSSPRRLSREYVRESSGAFRSEGAAAVKKGLPNCTENTVPWKELVQT